MQKHVVHWFLITVWVFFAPLAAMMKVEQPTHSKKPSFDLTSQFTTLLAEQLQKIAADDVQEKEDKQETSIDWCVTQSEEDEKKQEQNNAKAVEQIKQNLFAQYPLHWCVHHCYEDHKKVHRLLKELLQSGKYDVNVQDEWGNTALHWAANKDCLTCFTLLLNNKANPNIQSCNVVLNNKRCGGDTVAHLILQRYEVLESNSNEQVTISITSDDIPCTVPHNSPRGADERAIMQSMFLKLISHGADVTIKNYAGYTPLDVLSSFDEQIDFFQSIISHMGVVKDYNGLKKIYALLSSKRDEIKALLQKTVVNLISLRLAVQNIYFPLY